MPMYDDAHCMRDIGFLLGELAIDPVKAIDRWNEMTLVQQTASLWVLHGSKTARNDELTLRAVQFLMHHYGDSDLRTHYLDQPLRQQFLIMATTFGVTLQFEMNTEKTPPKPH